MQGDLQAKTPPRSLRNTRPCVSRCSRYDDLRHRGRGRRLGRHLGLGCLLRGPGRDSGPEGTSLIVHLLFTLSGHFGLQFRLARKFSIRLLAQASFVEILLLHRVEDRTELRCETIRKSSTTVRDDRRLTEPVCVNGSHLCHVLLGGEDKFMIDDICWGICGLRL